MTRSAPPAGAPPLRSRPLLRGMTLSRLLLPLALMALFTSSACGGKGMCSPATCKTGCCDAMGECAKGDTQGACGSAGAACTSCPLAQVCSAQMSQCVEPVRGRDDGNGRWHGRRNGRRRRRSVLITSNLVFSQWDRIFKDPMTTAAAIDRVVHHAQIGDDGREHPRRGSQEPSRSRKEEVEAGGQRVSKSRPDPICASRRAEQGPWLAPGATIVRQLGPRVPLNSPPTRSAA